MKLVRPRGPQPDTQYMETLLRQIEQAFENKADRQVGTIYVGENQPLVYIDPETGEQIEVPAGYALVGHNHDGTYALVGHNHDGIYPRTDGEFSPVPAIAGSDPRSWDTLTTPGWFYRLMRPDSPNGPPGGSGYWYALVMTYGPLDGDQNITQVAYPYRTGSAGAIHQRSRYNGAWTGWTAS